MGKPLPMLQTQEQLSIWAIKDLEFVCKVIRTVKFYA